MSYLPESSFLRAVVDFLLDAGRKGNCQSHYTSVWDRTSLLVKGFRSTLLLCRWGAEWIINLWLAKMEAWIFGDNKDGIGDHYKFHGGKKMVWSLMSHFLKGIGNENTHMIVTEIQYGVIWSISYHDMVLIDWHVACRRSFKVKLDQETIKYSFSKWIQLTSWQLISLSQWSSTRRMMVRKAEFEFQIRTLNK